MEIIRRFNYPDVFMYIDPPYLWKTRTAKQYRYEMTDADHELSYSNRLYGIAATIPASFSGSSRMQRNNVGTLLSRSFTSSIALGALLKNTTHGTFREAKDNRRYLYRNYGGGKE